ncbi:unnamed protein product [Protopolystoma xenopodis]|uniref:Uncharacterized protein n=1 Tax=Protopolystoma xenopodis TaxID=117903 RepID=A0A448X3Y7_9PLAT|nr:unnamed protein product [Protopolystoma xenopodis]
MGHAKETDPVKPYSSPTLCGKENELSSAPAVNAANADLADHGDLAEGEEAPKVGEVAESEGQKKRRPTKGQKKRAKLANLSQADAVVAEGRDPYQSPALWPSLPIWSIFQVRLWIARSDLCSDVSSTAER